jgi:hypothetical protein
MIAGLYWEPAQLRDARYGSLERALATEQRQREIKMIASHGCPPIHRSRLFASLRRF